MKCCSPEHERTPVIASTPEAARSIAELPPIIQTTIGFLSIMETLGFPESCIDYDIRPAAQLQLDGLGIDPTTPIISVRVTHDHRVFSYVLGAMLEDHDAWLARGKTLWQHTRRAERMTLYTTSALFKWQHFEKLLHTMLDVVQVRPPLALGFVYGRLANAEFADVLRHQPLPPSSPLSRPRVSPRPRTRASAPPPAPIGPPRWHRGDVRIHDDPHGVLEGVDVERFVARHLAGDWGESKFIEENEHALRTGRAILSVFRTDRDGVFWVMTDASRTLTTVMPETPNTLRDDVYMDIVCDYVATCPRSELPPAPEDALYCPAYLFGRFGPGSGLDEEHAVLLLFAAIGMSEHHLVPLRGEQALWAFRQAVLDIDFRPLDAAGRRVGPASTTAEHDAAEEACKDRQLCAWYAVRWEQRLS
jgi:hypothetical protein